MTPLAPEALTARAAFSHGETACLANWRCGPISRYNDGMTSLESVIGTLRAREPALRAMGVSLAAVFGSFARGEASDESDIDVLVDLDPARRLSLFDFIGIKHYLDDVIGSPVDLVSRRGVSPSILPAIERDMVRVF